MALHRFYANGEPGEFKETVQAFYESSSAQIDYKPLGDGPHHVDLRMLLLPGISLIQGDASPYRNNIITGGANSADHLHFGYCATVPMQICQEKVDFSLSPGEATLVAADCPGSIAAGQRSQTLAIDVPRERLAPQLTGLDWAMREGLKPSPELRLLMSYAFSLVAEEGEFAAATEAHSADHLCDLLNAVLGAQNEDVPPEGRPGTRAARLALLKGDIAANLGNPELSLEWLSKRHRMGARAIRNLFYGEGTNFTDFLLALRLDHAHSLLSAPATRNRTIISIAMEAGFEDISWFNRTFRRRFGMTPKDVRAMANDS